MRKTSMTAIVSVIVSITALMVPILIGRDGSPKTRAATISTFTDKRDGQVYRIVQVGGQTWFAENLNYEAEGSVCYKNSADSCAKYGRRYNWETALKACPAGTHLPSDKEWTALVDYAGGKEKAGMKLKSTSGWYNNGNGTDKYGFSALPDDYDSDLYSAGKFGYWWSATESDTTHAWGRFIHFYDKFVARNDYYKASPFSVRCVQNKEGEQ